MRWVENRPAEEQKQLLRFAPDGNSLVERGADFHGILCNPVPFETGSIPRIFQAEDYGCR
jgi:hypothetical protein